MKKFIQLLLLLALTACVGVPLPPTQDSPRTTRPSGPWYEVYFTTPGGKSLRGGPDAKLAAAIDDAKLTVDVAVLELDLWSIRDALLHAQQRGLQVRVVMESEYLDAAEVQDLLEAGIPVLGDRREGLMHNKFVVIDRQEVWTGSDNFTVSDTYKNNNNLIRIRSQALAEDYTAEFEEMFKDDQFGPGSPANTPNPTVSVEGTRIDVCFAPDDGCAARLVQALQSAKTSIDFMAFSFTSDDIAAAVLSRARQGVPVRGVMEASQVNSNAGTEFEKFLAARLDVRKDANPRNMHNKVFIIDGKIVVTGSYNFTYYGDTRNDENMLIIYNPDIAALYLAEFEKIYSSAK
jgi:phosphatidylserine/phosphatidylglycerophosphate/cardiolipin synthase-like enzyme